MKRIVRLKRVQQRPDGQTGKSRYARKVALGRQMYGNGSRPGKGCCANSHLFGFLK